jgi:hypothetical protein
MNASATDMRDFILALERETPRGLHPATDEALRWWFVELRDNVDNPTAVYELTGKICWRVVQELEFDAENNECVGDYREAYRCRRQAERFAARFNQPCDPTYARLRPPNECAHASASDDNDLRPSQ